MEGDSTKSIYTNPIKFVHAIFSMIFAFFGVFEFDMNSDKHVSKQSALNELRSIREGGFRQSEKVVRLWNLILSKHISRLGYEKYAILEQVFIAALDVGDEDLACECLDHLLTNFHNSCRVDRLFGMYLESKGGFEDAQKVYMKIINADPTNTFARKRLIAILKAQQKTPEAINELNQYLKIFMSDFEAWNELADLYLDEGDYNHAAFCMEEMLLSNPSNHLYCQRYAEIKYTEGGTENLEIARTYFAQASILCSNNLRSLYGLLLTCSALDSHLGKMLKMVPIADQHTTTTTTTTTTTNNKRSMENGSNSHKLLPIPNQGDGLFNTSTATTINNQSNNKSYPTLSESEKNRKLAKWAAEQIRSIYLCTEVPSNGANTFSKLAIYMKTVKDTTHNQLS